MRFFAYGLLALLIAAAMATGGTVLTMEQGNHHGANNGQNDQNDADHNETHNASSAMTAAGGGWFIVKNSTGAMFKDTFGFFLNANPGMFNNSSLVFHARDAGATVHAIQFDSVALDNTTVAGHWTAKAAGMATGAGKLWSFHLQVTDMGDRSTDRFMLMVMNGTTVLTWQTSGLGGGNISIPANDQNCEDQDEEDDSGPIATPFIGAFGTGKIQVKNATGALFNDTFAFSVDARTGFYNHSQLLFLARDAGLSIRSVEFDKIMLDNTTVAGHWTVFASGMAVGGGKNWTFELQATDVSLNGTMDLFMLSMTNGTQTMTWSANGLIHGNIVVLSLSTEMDMMDQFEMGSDDIRLSSGC